ncbi:MAG: hypothetical protein K2X81_00720, partial [Candidatus Obscuribacterales bacterium]|nr:hypothetical protein [Candidatus Obscuribacterales bacterium]
VFFFKTMILRIGPFKIRVIAFYNPHLDDWAVKAEKVEMPQSRFSRPISSFSGLSAETGPDRSEMLRP